jgi:hypothetical protein
MSWVIGYDNDTGPDDDYFAEWWLVTNGDKIFKAENEADAIVTGKPAF